MRVFNLFRHLYNAFFSSGKDAEIAKYVLLKNIGAVIYPKFKLSAYGRICLEDTDFLHYYEEWVSTKDYGSLDRRYVLDQLAKACAKVPGDTAECGTFRGASSLLICERIKGSGKAHHIFDSFEGISAPDDHIDGSHWKKGDFSCPEDKVRENLSAFDYVHYYKGWIPDRFPDANDRTFSFVHVDVDLLQPTLDSMAFFYPRMSPGGVILCDDYGFVFNPGAQQAMDEYFADKPEEVVSLPTGQGMVIKL